MLFSLLVENIFDTLKQILKYTQGFFFFMAYIKIEVTSWFDFPLYNNAKLDDISYIISLQIPHLVWKYVLIPGQNTAVR